METIKYRSIFSTIDRGFKNERSFKSILDGIREDINKSCRTISGNLRCSKSHYQELQAAALEYYWYRQSQVAVLCYVTPKGVFAPRENEYFASYKKAYTPQEMTEKNFEMHYFYNSGQSA